MLDGNSTLCNEEHSKRIESSNVVTESGILIDSSDLERENAAKQIFSKLLFNSIRFNFDSKNPRVSIVLMLFGNLILSSSAPSKNDSGIVSLNKSITGMPASINNEVNLPLSFIKHLLYTRSISSLLIMSVLFLINSLR